MDKLLDKLKSDKKPVIEEQVQKWDGFCSKVEERLLEIFEEAEAGITDVMQTNPYDNEPLFAAFKMVNSRFLKIAKKVRDAAEKMEETWEETIETFDKVKGKEEDALEDLLDKMTKRGRDLDDGLESKKELWEIDKQAQWAFMLQDLLEKEKDHKVSCTGCGSDLEMTSLHTMNNAPCPYCSVVNTITPPPATLMYYSWGVDLIASQDSLDDYKQMLKTEEKYENKSNSKTRGSYKEAIEKYWNHYYKKVEELYPNHPHLAEGFDTAVERKVERATFALT